MESPTPQRTARRRLIRVLAWVLLAVLAYFAWPSQWGGATTYVVVDGTSMQPGFHTGDIVIAREADDHDVGDVLVYAVPEGYTGAGELIMHRLTSITDEGRYVIQGDNRDEPDQFDVGPENVVGVARLHIPKVGMATQILGQWGFIALLIGLLVLAKLWPDAPARVEGEERNGGDRRAVAVDEMVPAHLATSETVPPETVPPETVPPETVPPETVPTETVPPETVAAEMVPPPPAPGRRTRPYVIVDGLGLAHAGWPTVGLDVTRQMAVDAADDIAGRYGTVAAVLFEPAPRPVSARHSALVEFMPVHLTMADAVRAHLAERRDGLMMLVVTDVLPVAEEVVALGGSVMRCAAWLALGQSAGSALAVTPGVPDDGR